MKFKNVVISLFFLLVLASINFCAYAQSKNFAGIFSSTITKDFEVDLSFVDYTKSNSSESTYVNFLFPNKNVFGDSDSESSDNVPEKRKSPPENLSNNIEYSLENPTDISIQVEWNDATVITSINDDYGRTLIKDAHYRLSGSLLTFLRSYFVTVLKEPGDYVVLTIIFDEGDDVILSVTAVADPGFMDRPIKSATISHNAVYYNINERKNVSVRINWNDATEITNIVDELTAALVPIPHFETTNGNLTFYSSYLSTVLLKKNDQIEFTISFNKGKDAILKITALETPVPEETAVASPPPAPPLQVPPATVTQPATPAQVEDKSEMPAVTNGRPFENNQSTRTVVKPKEQNGLIFYFKYSSFYFDKGEIISNVFAVHNNQRQTVRFMVDVTAPDEWQPFSRNRVYEVKPGDSIFIPIRIVPRSLFSGGTRYMFSALAYDERDNLLGYAMFYAFTKKQLKWELSVDNQKHYLLQDEINYPFSISVFNQVQEPQAIQIQAQGLSHNFSITDSMRRDIMRRPTTITLGSMEDTTFHYLFTETLAKRNEKVIDIENYNPYNSNVAKKYSVFFRSVSPNPTETAKFQSSKRVEFIKLPNNLTVNRYGSNRLPLVFDMNSYNVLGMQPITNIHLYGNGQVSEDASLYYSSSLIFSTYNFSSQAFENAGLYLGYYHTRFNVQVGNVSGNLMGIQRGGKGIRGEYYIDNRNRVNAFYSQGRRLFSSPEMYSFGGGYSYNSRKINFATQIGRGTNVLSGRSSDIANVQFNTRLIQNHSFGLRGGMSRNTTSDTATIIPIGYYVGGDYSGQFLNRSLHTNLTGMYFAPGFGLYRGERINTALRTSYRTQKWNLSLINRMYLYKYLSSNEFFDVRLGNNLTYSRNATRLGNVRPNLFYDVSRISMFEVHSRGLGLGFSSFDYTGHTRYYLNLRGGYNKAVKEDNGNYFFLQANSMIHYKVWSFTVRYNLGNYALSREMFFLNTHRNPQTINLSLRNQYELPFLGWVMQNAVTYGYNTLYGSNASIIPEIYYFSRGGWRFRAFSEWSLLKKNKNNYFQNHYYLPREDEGYDEPWRSNVHIGLGLRKEFGVPIPWRRDEYCSVECVAFYDLNGNGIKDKDEKEIENVVIRIGPWEVLTSDKGVSSIKNIPAGMYPWSAFSLEYVNGWFPYLPDSVAIVKDGVLNIPFIRGVKLNGQVVVSREQMSATADDQLDLSKIKITASNHKLYTTLTDRNANFSFYVPKGLYTITLDESILGDRFQLLQNNIEVEVDENIDNLFLTFYIVERRRRVRVTRFGNQEERTSHEAERFEVERKAREEAFAKAEQERLARESSQRERVEAERTTRGQSTEAVDGPVFQQAESSRLESERIAREQAAEVQRIENERIVREQAAADTQAQLPFRSEVERLEAERIAREKAMTLEATDEIILHQPNDVEFDSQKIDYRLQLGAYRVPVDTDHFSDIDSKIQEFNVVGVRTSDGLHRYTIGSFNTIEDARAFHANLERLGYSALLVAFRGNENISIREAQILLGQ